MRRSVKHTLQRRWLVYSVISVVWVMTLCWYSRYSIADIAWYQFGYGLPLSVLGTDSPYVNMQLGNHFFSHDHYNIDRARAHYTKALSVDPMFPGANYQRGRTYFVTGDFASAMRDVQTEMVLYPALGKTHYMKGLIAGYQKNFNLSGAEFLKFIYTDPANWAGYNDLSWILFQQGRFSDAEKIIKVGLGYNPDNAWLLNGYGTALLSEGNPKGAEVVFKQSHSGFGAMQPEDWGNAYPGNSPKVIEDGLKASVAATERNINRALVAPGDSRGEKIATDFLATLAMLKRQEDAGGACTISAKPIAVLRGSRAVVSWNMSLEERQITCILTGTDARGNILESKTILTPQSKLKMGNMQTVPLTIPATYTVRCTTVGSEEAGGGTQCTQKTSEIGIEQPPFFEKDKAQ